MVGQIAFGLAEYPPADRKLAGAERGTTLQTHYLIRDSLGGRPRSKNLGT